MSWPEIDEKEFIQLTHKHTLKELAKIYRVSEKTIYRRKKKIKERGIVVGEAGFPLSQTKDFLDHIVVEADRAIIISDCEIPDHNSFMFSLALSLGQRFNIKKLIIAGDFLAMDSFSSWARSIAYTLAFKQELEPAKESLRIFLRWFDEAIWIYGNHEVRLSHKVDGQINIGDFFSDFAGLKCSEYPHLVLKSGGKDIFVTHPSSYSRKALSIPYELASKKLMNVVSAHGHHLAFGYDRSSQFWICDCGHCRDVNKTHYKNLRDTTHPEWDAGFVMIIDGYPFLIDENNADFWLGVTLEKEKK